MASCELCGKNTAEFKTQVEGTMMNVCKDCSRFGDVKGKSNVRIVVQESRKPAFKEPEYIFVSGYGNIVKNAREKLKLTQEDFAKKISEHKSLIHQVESEHIKPSIVFAKKLEKSLGITIVEEVVEDKDNKNSNQNQQKNFSGRNSASTSQGLTFADFIKKK
ncbi:MAG TPA: multiprotein-bridging factor 1 family protein [Alphaproteobacteria bacterium]|nr:multiprotein-bridging factor 1 family protein [Alphaproteobacteria bacterium]